MKKIKLFLQQRKQFLFSLPMFFLINILFISNNTIGQTATVANDKLNFPPSSTVSIRGSYWVVYQTVALEVYPEEEIKDIDISTSVIHAP